MKRAFLPFGAILVSLLAGCSAVAPVVGQLCPPAEALGVEGPNLIVNGDCEAGTPVFGASNTASAGTWALSTVRFRSGSKSLAGSHTTTGGRSFTLNNGSYSGLKAGASYVFRCFANLPAAQSSYLPFTLALVQVLNGSQPLVSAVVYPAAADSWQLLEIRFTAPASATVMYLQLQQQASAANALTFFDDFELREVTDPTPPPSPTPTPTPTETPTPTPIPTTSVEPSSVPR